VDFLEQLDGAMNEWLVVAGTVLAAVSGVPGAFERRDGGRGERAASVLMVLGALSAIVGAALVIARPSVPVAIATGIDLGWSVPGGRFAVRVDGISALFVIQIFLIAALGAVYGLGYWKQACHTRDGRKLRLFYGFMTAGMALLVVARNTMLFMVGWEIMALAAFLTLTSQDDQRPVRQVGYVYMVATRLATLCLFAMFAVLFAATGGFDFALPVPIGDGASTAIFLLAMVGFGLKAGVMPMHVWLPGAHANAPSHVSALMSGVLIKMGIYGMIRVFSLFPHPPLWWGEVVLGLGVISGILGVAFAIGQHDFKRLLAYHSVENIGIICMDLGVALLGRSLGNGALVALGLGGALLHVWNHGLFKSLLFLSAGSVLHATHTREIDELGGIAKRMPWTALGFLVGAVAICGLPPLNGFVSELLVYLALFKSAALPEGTLWLAGALGAPALALIGALALACFVKVYGAMFLGEPRTHHTDGATESPSWMLGPLGVLAGLCALVGLLPWLVAPILDRAVSSWAGELAGTGRLAVLAPLAWVSLVGALLVVGLLAGALLVRRNLRNQAVPQTGPIQIGTWDCGYVAPGPTMQYSSSSFAQTLVGLFSWALRPKVKNPDTRGLFPHHDAFTSNVDDVVLDSVLIPAAELGTRAARRLKWVQRGSMQAYLLYILLTLIVLFFWR
jgi:hydrogenase-4 component B